MTIERWNWSESEHRGPFAGQPFVSVDPGRDGYAMGWEPSEANPIAYCHALEPDSLWGLLERLDANVVVVESQYVTSLKNARHIVELTFRSGLSLGWTAARLHYSGHDLQLFEVAPSTWQAHQRREYGITGKRERGQGIELALSNAEEHLGQSREWQEANKKQREGMASALAIGQWWKSL